MEANACWARSLMGRFTHQALQVPALAVDEDGHEANSMTFFAAWVPGS